MTAALARNIAKRVSRLSPRIGLRQVTQRNNADKPFLAVQHWQTPNLDVAHILQNMAGFLILEAKFYVCAHDLSRRSIRSQPLCDAANGDVPIGYHSHQPVVVAYRYGSGVDFSHHPGDTRDRIVRASD